MSDTVEARVPIERQIAEVRRELAMRRRVYPRWVSAGRMAQDEADKFIAAMEAVQGTLERLRDAQRAHREPGLF